MKGRELILIECLQLSSALHGTSPFTDIPSTLWTLRKVYEDIFKEIWFSILGNNLKLYDSKVTSYNSNVFTTISPNGFKGKKKQCGVIDLVVDTDIQITDNQTHMKVR